MTTLFDCTLGGAPLSSIDESICILDIREDAPQMHLSTLALHSGSQRILSCERQSLTVRVRFAIQEESPTLRSNIAARVRRWARSSAWLNISQRPGQRLHVQCSELPALSGNDWTEELTLAFTSDRAPYWEDATQTSFSGTGAVTLTIPGTAKETPVEVVAINNSGRTITHVEVQCGNAHMTFEDLVFPANGQLALSMASGVFTARISGESVLHHRTMDSSDMLLASCGEEITAVTTADASIFTFYNVRGRYE